MPLDKSMSHEEMVAELIRSYKKSGRIGATEPRDMKHALEIANAVAYNLEESNYIRKVKEMKLEEVLEGLEAYVTSREKELGIFSEDINPHEIVIDSSLHKGEEARYYQENLQGKTVTHPVLGDIYLGKKGRRETIYKSPSKYMGILCYIDKIIQGGYSNGEVDEPRHPRKDSVTGFYYIYDEVLYDGVPLGVTVEICEDSKGRKYYMFKAYTNEKYYQNTEVLLDEQEANREGSTSNSIINDDEEKVKPGDKFMLGDFIEITVLDTPKKDKNEALENPKVKVTLDNGETFETEVDPNTSEDELKKQYAVGSEISVGREGQERKARIKSATLTKTVGEDFEFIPTEVEFTDEEENPIDIISLDVPLFLRLLEWAREDATEDVELHDVAERAITIMQNNTEFLSMEEYDAIIGNCCTGAEPPVCEADMGDMGADQILPMGRKNKAKALNRKRPNRLNRRNNSK